MEEYAGGTGRRTLVLDAIAVAAGVADASGAAPAGSTIDVTAASVAFAVSLAAASPEAADAATGVLSERLADGATALTQLLRMGGVDGMIVESTPSVWSALETDGADTDGAGAGAAQLAWAGLVLGAGALLGLIGCLCRRRRLLLGKSGGGGSYSRRSVEVSQPSVMLTTFDTFSSLRTSSTSFPQQPDPSSTRRASSFLTPFRRQTSGHGVGPSAAARGTGERSPGKRTQQQPIVNVTRHVAQFAHNDDEDESKTEDSRGDGENKDAPPMDAAPLSNAHNRIGSSSSTSLPAYSENYAETMQI